MATLLDLDVLAERAEDAEDAADLLRLDLAALRAAVARLMATGTRQPWWADWDVTDGTVSCQFCAAPWSTCPEDVTHDADCPALAVEAAMRGDA